ncbi:prolyl oligopeptidase family serine peptidase [Rhizobium etli]|uniref:prolyl oligopeptidase family serine peptidase n=1 Tax=Rhizobium etli TaxID=29449 RepID=UPI00059FE09A|nr:prolyl oligopeptidase family serine peptidase [Rhizobium etli]
MTTVRRMRPPLAHEESRIRVLHDDVTTDRFRWLRDKEHPKLHSYLNAENDYAEHSIAHLGSLKAELIAEIKGRQPSDDILPAFRVGPFEYVQRRADGKAHPVWWRRPVTGGAYQIIFDPNEVAGAERFYSLGVFEPSDDGRYIAYSFDVVGSEWYKLHVRDVDGGRDVWHDVGRAGRAVWASDNQTLFFTRERADRRHHDQVVCVNILDGQPEVIFEEANERLAVVVRRSNSGDWLFIDVYAMSDNSGAQRGAAEVWCLPSDQPRGTWRRVVGRDLGHKVYAEHWHDRFLFRVDDAGAFCRIVSAPLDSPSPCNWKELVPHRTDVNLEEVHILEQHLIVLERKGLCPSLVAYEASGEMNAVIVRGEPSCTLIVGLSARGRYSVGRQPFHSGKVLYTVSSFVTPDKIVEHNLIEDRSSILSHASVSGYDSEQYEATVVMAKGEDGVDIPISLVMRRDRKCPGPLLLNVYGCYGTCRWPSFFSWPSSMTERLSLLDRGYAFGIVHVRGGGELGRSWHKAATRERKQVTHTDLIAAAEGLIDQGVTTRGSIIIEGKSAGGGTVLSASHLRPDLFCAVLAEVPLTDIIDTEFDFTLPFALSETTEYGDPHEVGEYRYLRTYDPYYNLCADRVLPPTYIDAAFEDGQVLYYQPARYVAQRRFCSLDSDPELVFRTRFVGGHGGASHGPDVAEQAAYRMTWIIKQITRSHT